MPGAVILADQPAGAGSGSAGVARNDLWLGRAVNLSCAVGGNSTYLWELLAKPAASAVTLATPTSSTSTFTPDVVGTYRVRLTTNGGGVGNSQTLVLRARYDNAGALTQRGWAYPGYGELAPEANYGGNDRGWSEVFESILEDIRANLGGASSPTLVYDSGATPSAGVFDDFADAIAFANTLDGRAAIYMRTNATLSSGTYDLEDVELVGDPSVLPTLTISGATMFSGFPFSIRDVVLDHQGNATLYAGDVDVVVSGRSELKASTADYIIYGTGRMWLRDFAKLSCLSTAPAWYLTTSATGYLIATDDALLENSGSANGTIEGALTTEALVVHNRSAQAWDVDSITVNDITLYDQSIAAFDVDIYNATTFNRYTKEHLYVSVTLNSNTDDLLVGESVQADIILLNPTLDISLTGLQVATQATTRSMKLLVNKSAFDITLPYDDAGSTAAYRWLTSDGNDIKLGAGEAAIATYDWVTARHRVFKLGGGESPAVTELTDDVTIAVDASLGTNFQVTITNNRTLGNPTNGIAGQRLVVAVRQDGTGGRTLAFDTDWVSVDPTTTINTTASSVSIVEAWARDFGAGVKWFYRVSHVSESLTQGYGITVSGQTVSQKTTPVTLSFASPSVAIDASTGPNYKLTLTGSTQLANPSNLAEGQHFRIAVMQDGVGGHALTFASNWVAIDPSVTVKSAASAVSYIMGTAFDTGSGVRILYAVMHDTESSGANTSVTTLTISAGAVTIDSSVGSEFQLTLTQSITLNNPTNGVAGNSIRCLISQNASGGWLITFGSDWVNEGRNIQPAQGASTTTLLVAYMRGTKWYYTLQHSELIEVTPAAISVADQTAWNPTGRAYADLLRGSCTTTTRNLHGIVAPSRYTEKTSFKYTHTGSFNLVLKHASATEATAANRLQLASNADITVYPDDTLEFHYDFTSARWRVF